MLAASCRNIQVNLRVVHRNDLRLVIFGDGLDTSLASHTTPGPKRYEVDVELFCAICGRLSVIPRVATGRDEAGA